MYIYKHFRLFFSFLVLVFFITACAPKVPEDRYSVQECKEELLEAKDYAQNRSIDKIVVVKQKRKMYLYKAGQLIQAIPVSLGKNPLGHKQEKGDYRTPEGEYFIHRKLCSPKYYRSLCISYPRPSDIQSAKARGVNPGGDITIHAQPKWNADGKGDSYTLARNWTQGCIAVTNEAMQELWYAVREGIPITIR